MDGGGRSNQRKLAEATETDGAQRSPLTEISEAVLRHCMWVHVLSASSAHEGEQQVRERHMLVLVYGRRCRVHSTISWRPSCTQQRVRCVGAHCAGLLRLLASLRGPRRGVPPPRGPPSSVNDLPAPVRQGHARSLRYGRGGIRQSFLDSARRRWRTSCWHVRRGRSKPHFSEGQPPRDDAQAFVRALRQ